MKRKYWNDSPKNAKMIQLVDGFFSFVVAPFKKRKIMSTPTQSVATPTTATTPHLSRKHERYVAAQNRQWERANAKASGLPVPPLSNSLLSGITTKSEYKKKAPMGDRQRKDLIRRRDSGRIDILKQENTEIRAKGEGDFKDLSDYKRTISLQTLADDAFLPSNDIIISSKSSKSIRRKRVNQEGDLARALEVVRITEAQPDFTQPRLDAWKELIAARAAVQIVETIPKRRKYPKRLSPADQQIVNAAFKQSGIVSSLPGAEVASKDLVRLKGLQWLNDEVITFWAIMINQRSKEEEQRLADLAAGGAVAKVAQALSVGGGSGMEILKAYSFTSFFYTTFVGRGYAAVRRWTKKTDLFAYDIVIIPINLANSHWVCSAINMKKKRFEYYDSLGPASAIVYKRLRAYLMEEHLDKKKTPIDLSDWENYWDDDVPRQENHSDCGIFTAIVQCQFMESLSRTEAFDFDQAQMPYFRNKMVLEIKQCRLLPEEFED